MRSRELDAQADKRAADAAIQPLFHAGFAGEALRDTTRDPGDKAVPDRAHRDEYDAEREESERFVLTVRGDELRKKRYEEQHDLRIQHIRDETLREELKQRFRRGFFVCLRFGGGVGLVMLRENQAHAEIDQINRAGNLDDGERGRRCGEDRRQTERARERMDDAASRNAERRHDARAAPLSDTASDDVRSVGAGRDVEKKYGDEEEGKTGDAEHRKLQTGECVLTAVYFSAAPVSQSLIGARNAGLSRATRPPGIRAPAGVC